MFHKQPPTGSSFGITSQFNYLSCFMSTKEPNNTLTHLSDSCKHLRLSHLILTQLVTHKLFNLMYQLDVILQEGKGAGCVGMQLSVKKKRLSAESRHVR